MYLTQVHKSDLAKMEECHRQVIRMNTVFLTKNVNVTATCMSLIEKGIFHYANIDHLLHPCTSSQTRCSELLDLIKRRGPEAWEIFLTTLDETDQEYIANRMRIALDLYLKNTEITSADFDKFFKNY